MSKHAIPESRIVLIAALIQFINVTDFMMVMPLGPDFSRALGIAMEKIGIIAGSYTFSAALFGIIAAFFLDRFQRRKAIIVCLAGLIGATALGAVVWSEASMIAARILAGAFGGPLTALGIALIADSIPPERRGAAMGKVMGGFALASVFGVPFGLELAQYFSWHAPFISTAGFGVVVWILALRWLPDYAPSHVPASIRVMTSDIATLLKRPVTLYSFCLTSVVMMSGFMIIPNISAYLQFNLHVPRDSIGVLYLLGGATSFFSMRLAGKLVDRWSAVKTMWLFTLMFVIVVLIGFTQEKQIIPIALLFICFMVSMTGRGVAGQTLTSKVPPPQLRGAFLSLQSTVTHIATSLGAGYSAMILRSSENGALVGVPTLAYTAIMLALIAPFLYQKISAAVSDRSR